MLNEVRKHLALATVEPGQHPAKDVLARLAKMMPEGRTGRGGRDTEICFGESGLTIEAEDDNTLKITFYDPNESCEAIEVSARVVLANMREFAAAIKKFNKVARDLDREIRAVAERMENSLQQDAQAILRAVGNSSDVVFTLERDHNDGNPGFAAWVRE